MNRPSVYRVWVSLPVLYFVMLLSAKGQDHGFFEQVWLEQGLSQSSVMTITQDQQGFIWFGTQDGLNRYDGRNIDKFNFQPFNPNSISGDVIEQIYAESPNKLWVLSGMGLDLLDLHSLKATHLLEQIAGTKVKSRFIFKIWMLNDKLFVFTSTGINELKRGKSNNWELLPYKIERIKSGEKKMEIAAACMDEENNLYIGTTEGIYTCPSGSNLFHFFQPRLKGVEEEKVCNTIFYKNNTLYFSQENIFYSYHAETKQLFSFFTGDRTRGGIYCSLLDNRNNVWLGTNSNGLFMLSQQGNGQLVQEKHFMSDKGNLYGLRSNMITSLFQANHADEDVVWIGTREAGAFAYCYSKNSFQLVSAGTDNPQTSFFGLTKDRSNVVWALTHTGLYSIDRDNKKFSFIDLTSLNEKARRPAEGIYCDNKDDVWTGISNTLYKVDKKSNKLIKVAGPLVDSPYNHIYDITENGEDELLIGCGQGLVVYNKVSGKITHIREIIIHGKKTNLPTVGSVFSDSQQNWWMGTARGLFYMDRKKNTARQYIHNPENKTSLLSSWVMDIRETSSGEMLIATTKGLSILKDRSKENAFENYYAAPGLKNNFIYGMVPDKQGNFWMTTNYGVTVFKPEKRTFRTYDSNDGTYVNEFNSNGYFSADDGELLFGGIDGLISVYPDKMIKNLNPPRLVLRSFKMNGKDADSLLFGDSTALDFRHHQNSFYFEFSVPDFSDRKGGRLLYRLEGFENGWTEIGETQSFSLLNMAPGNYSLQVKAVNSEGVECLRPFRVDIQISPPFWKSSWFYALALMLFAGISWILYRYRLQVKIERLKEMERIRQEENDRVRKAAALDLHDEFGNGLTRISMLVEIAKMKIPKENTEANKFLGVISENSARLYQGTKDFIWSISPGNDNLYETIIRIKDFGDELFVGTGTSFEVNGLDEELKKQHQLPGTSRNITMIFKEALTNIVKYSGADKVRFAVEKSESSILLTLKDNGKGFNTLQNGNGFGISNMKHRASQIGASIKVQSKDQEGCEIILTLKRQEKNDNGQDK